MHSQKKFYEAIQKGDLITVRACLALHREWINLNDYNNQTPLTYAIYWGHQDVIKGLLQTGAKWEAMNKKDFNALAYAVLLSPSRKQQKETVRLLRDYEAQFPSPLHEAVYNRNTAQVNEALMQKIPIDVMDSARNTPLHYAAAIGATSVIKQLIDAGAEVKQKNIYGFTALLCAARYGQKDCIAYLLTCGASLLEENNKGEIAVELASYNGYTKTVTWLVRDIGDPIKRVSNINRAFLSGAENGYTETLIELMKLGANLSGKAKGGWTALLRAAMYGHTETVAWLIEQGANIEEKNHHDSTALLLAAWNGHTETVAYLLQHGANFAAENNNRETALCLAVKEEHPDTIACLLQHGATLVGEANKKYVALLRSVLKKDAIQTVLKQQGWGLDAFHQNLKVAETQGLLTAKKKLALASKVAPNILHSPSSPPIVSEVPYQAASDIEIAEELKQLIVQFTFSLGNANVSSGYQLWVPGLGWRALREEDGIRIGAKKAANSDGISCVNYCKGVHFKFLPMKPGLE
ncbi:MAG: ankyrin repeat domain-containing protein, partial [Gammaproteobacteria bacterium]|nr:ankyrin repeat domain-containing protein [Gammaproteobacteria bacterium]